MSTASKWLLAFVVLLNLGTAYLALQVLGESRKVRGQINTLEKQIAQETLRTRQLAVGTEEAPGIALLRTRLHDVVTRRGRAWYDAQPAPQIDPQSQQIVVQVQLQEPFVPSEEVKGVLFAFEQDAPLAQAGADAVAAEGEPAAPAPPAGAPRRYVGEFRVAAAEGKTVTLVPAQVLTPEEQQALLASQGPWTLYDVLPIDTHSALAGLDEAAVRGMLRVDQREGEVRERLDAMARQYLRDGQDAAADDPADNVVEGKYRRTLIDYGFLLRELDRQRTLLYDRLQATQSELGYLAASIKDAQTQSEFHELEKAELAKRREQLNRELAAVETLRESIQNELSQTRANVDRLLVENRELATQVAEAQFAALRKANEASSYDNPAPTR